MPDLVSSLASCLERDSKRLSEDGLLPGGACLAAGPVLKASTVRLLLSPVGPWVGGFPGCRG